jgi:Phosphatidylglycerol lysyltransferase, C-terminal/OB-fold nucleic acid binding domain
VRFDREHTAADVLAQFGGLAAGDESGEEIRIAGRAMLIRCHGGLLFADVHDQTGTVQMLVSRDDVGPDAFADAKALDRGDWIGVTGTPLRTRAGELSVRAREVRLLSKALRALPDKHRGLTDVARHHRFRLMRETDASPELCEQLNAIRDRWRGKAPERGFTMELGGGVRGDDPELLLAIAFDGDEHPVAFLRLVPCFGDSPGYSLDLMQRDPGSVNGVTEFLIASTALALGERGYDRLSLNFAAWGRLFDESAHLSVGERVQRRVAKALNPFFQIESLRDFNAKFDPEWLPRSIVLSSPASMPKVGLLYASVEGFVNVPLVGRYLVPTVRG